MRIDESSLAFGYTADGAGNPNWSISLGQSHPSYRINLALNPGLEPILISMTYCAIPVCKVTTRMGKGAPLVTGIKDGTPIIAAALYQKVYINDTLIENGKFILLIDKDQSPSHAGRLRLRYSKHNTYTTETATYSNDEFFKKAQDALGLAENACWFVYDISVDNQDTLRMRAIVVNKDGPVEYANSKALHTAWDALLAAELPLDEASHLEERDIETSPDDNIVVDNIPEDLSVQELGDILATMYNTASNKVASIHVFGIKYGALIIKKGYSANAIVAASGINASYDTEVNKGINVYKAIRDNKYGVCFLDKEDVVGEASKGDLYTYSAQSIKGVNKIFFGVPGCGKSHHIQYNILNSEGYKANNVIRTTFYQDYSNTDFVGQILPKIVKGQNGEKDSVEYIFNPGPFTLALIQAISNPDEKVALVIEEINRGNAPAIFGDIFQLLDRDHNSISEYGIINVSMMDFLNNYTFNVGGVDTHYTFEEIKIPGNLFIYATMNTSDQNVYTLDTAFVRRWEKEKIPNVFSKCSFRNVNVPGMNCTWEKFVNSINKCIASHLEDLQINEDKQIGAFFVKESLLAQGDVEKFAYKVFDYLWSDVAKLDHGVFFNHYDTLDQLIKAYVQNGVAVFKPGIFVEEIVTTQQNEADDE